jgi:hypothetical protein
MLGRERDSVARAGVVFALACVLSVSAVGCAAKSSKSAETTSSAEQTETIGVPLSAVKEGASQLALDRFFKAQVKQGRMVYTPPDTTQRANMQYWVDHEKMRMDFFTFNGFIYLSVIVPDGKLAYDVYPRDQETIPSFTDAEFEKLMFYGPPDGKLGKGRQVGDLAAYRYPVKRWWAVKGAGQTFYVEDITYYTDGSSLVKEVVRAAGGQTTHDAVELASSTYEFATPEYNTPIHVGTFAVPYLKK